MPGSGPARNKELAKVLTSFSQVSTVLGVQATTPRVFHATSHMVHATMAGAVHMLTALSS